MERGVPIAMRKLSFALALLLSSLAVPPARADGQRELVLAASATSAIPKLTLQETRKLYLGVPVEKNGVTIKPLVNVSDPLLFEVFLQKVTFMSADAYEKQVIAIVFRMGGQRPESFQDPERLIGTLLEQPNAVTFVWASELGRYQGIKSVNTLWAGTID